MKISGTIPCDVISVPEGVKYFDVVKRKPEPSLVRKIVCTVPFPYEFSPIINALPESLKAPATISAALALC